MKPFATPRCVVVVDDDPLFAFLVGELVRRVAPTTLIYLAYDGHSALRMIYRYKPDVVYIDLRLPELDGKEVLSQVRADPTLTATRIIVCTGYGNLQDEKEVLALGANAYLVKPVTVADIQRQVWSF